MTGVQTCALRSHRLHLCHRFGIRFRVPIRSHPINIAESRIRAAATGRVEHPLLTQLTDFPKLFLACVYRKKFGKVCQVCQCRAPGARAPARTHRGRGEGRITPSVRLHIVDFPASIMLKDKGMPPARDSLFYVRYVGA